MLMRTIVRTQTIRDLQRLPSLGIAEIPDEGAMHVKPL